jgi:hypothetical protein
LQHRRASGIHVRFIKGERIGKALVTRTDTKEDVGVITPVEVTSEYHASFAFEPNPGPYPFNPAISYPPSGTCTAYEEAGDILDSNPLPDLVPTTLPLDLGPAFQLTGPNGTKTLNVTFIPARVGYIGGLISNNILPNSLYLNPGSYNLQGFGGTDVGPFTTSFTIPQPVTWTNRDAIVFVDRTQPLTVNWSGGDSGQVVAFVGFGVDLPGNSSGVFFCIAPPGATSFTIPTDMLSNLPATRTDPLHSKDVIYMITSAGGGLSNLNAMGLDVGITEYYSILGKTVVFE